jgi:hypothetical protein
VMITRQWGRYASPYIRLLYAGQSSWSYRYVGYKDTDGWRLPARCWGSQSGFYAKKWGGTYGVWTKIWDYQHVTVKIDC